MVVPPRLREALLLMLANGCVPVAPESQLQPPTVGGKTEHVVVGEQRNVLPRLHRVTKQYRNFILAGVFALIGLLIVAAIAILFATGNTPIMTTEIVTDATTPIITIPTTTKLTITKPTTTKAATYEH
jgi:hypothetical protein